MNFNIHSGSSVNYLPSEELEEGSIPGTFIKCAFVCPWCLFSIDCLVIKDSRPERFDILTYLLNWMIDTQKECLIVGRACVSFSLLGLPSLIRHGNGYPIEYVSLFTAPICG